MKPDIERRFCPLRADNEATVEIRSGETPKIRGLAAAYGKWSLDLGGFREIIAPGAFDDVLAAKELDVVALFDHVGQPLGRSTSGTLRLWTDERGLNYEIDPPDTQLARDVMHLLARGDLFGSSFAFTVETGSGEEWERDEDGGMRRTIKRFSGLYDVSVVTHAAYGNATSAALRSLEQWQAEATKPQLAAADAARLVLARAKARAAVVKALSVFPATVRDEASEKRCGRGFCPTGKDGGIDNSCGTGDGSGESPGGGLGPPAAKHNVALPKDPKRLTVDQADSAMKQMGYEVGETVTGKEGGSWVTKTAYTDSDGKSGTLTAQQVKEFVYKNHSDPDVAKTKVPKKKPRR